MGRPIRDLTGKVFERLTVVDRAESKDKRGSAYWNCLCECGEIIVVRGGHLTSGNTRSCKCLNREVASVCTPARLTGKREKDAPNYKGGRIKTGKGYIDVLSHDHPNRGKKGYVREHHLVMEKHLGRYLTKDEVVHHKNGIKDDNRIENLMLFATTAEHTAYHWNMRHSEGALA